MARLSRPKDSARIIIHDFRELTEQQFDFWLERLNEAVSTMGSGEQFTRDDRQKTISYWYVLMFLLELYADEHDPFASQSEDAAYTAGIITMRELSEKLRNRYMEETVRRYVTHLKKCRLVDHEGRGPDAKVMLSTAAISALTQTIRRWITAFRRLDERLARLGVK